jgi:hypothetical protein
MYSSFSELAPAGLLIPDAPCSGRCATSRPQLGSLAGLDDWLPGFSNSYQTGYTYGTPGFDSFGSGSGFPGSLSFTDDPTGALASDKWYAPILDVVGDVGADLLGEMKEWLKRRIGEETWNAMPEESKQAAIAQAWQDVRGRATGAISPAMLGALALLAVVLLAPRRRARR